MTAVAQAYSDSDSLLVVAPRRSRPSPSNGECCTSSTTRAALAAGVRHCALGAQCRGCARTPGAVPGLIPHRTPATGVLEIPLDVLAETTTLEAQRSRTTHSCRKRVRSNRRGGASTEPGRAAAHHCGGGARRGRRGLRRLGRDSGCPLVTTAAAGAAPRKPSVDFALAPYPPHQR